MLRFERDERYFVWCMLRSGPQEPGRPHPLATLVRSIERRDEDISVASPTTLVLLGKLFRYPKQLLERLESARLLTYFDNLDVVSAFVSSSDAQLPMAISAEMRFCNRGDAAATPVPESLHLLSSRIDEAAFVAAVKEYPPTMQRVCVSIFPYLDQRIPPRPTTDTRATPNAAGRLRIESYPGVIRTLYEGLARRPHQLEGHGLGLLVLRYDRTCGEFCMVPRCAQHPGSPYRNHVRPSEEEEPGAEGVRKRSTKLVTVCCDWGQAAPTSSARDVSRDKAFVKRIWERMVRHGRITSLYSSAHRVAFWKAA